MNIYNTNPDPAIWLYSLKQNPRLSGEAKLVGALLVAYLSDDGVARPGVKALARLAGLSEFVVSRALRDLRMMGLVHRVGGRLLMVSGSYDHYRIALEVAA